jgi:hypothetical protein
MKNKDLAHCFFIIDPLAKYDKVLVAGNHSQSR